VVSKPDWSNATVPFVLSAGRKLDGIKVRPSLIQPDWSSSTFSRSAAVEFWRMVRWVSAVDSGVSAVDIGFRPVDSGVSAVDSGVSAVDSGVSAVTAGSQRWTLAKTDYHTHL